MPLRLQTMPLRLQLYLIEFRTRRQSILFVGYSVLVIDTFTLTPFFLPFINSRERNLDIRFWSCLGLVEVDHTDVAVLSCNFFLKLAQLRTTQATIPRTLNLYLTYRYNSIVSCFVRTALYFMSYASRYVLKTGSSLAWSSSDCRE